MCFYALVSATNQVTLFNMRDGFISGVADSKLSIYVSRKKKVEDSVDSDLLLILTRAIKVRITIDFNFHSRTLNSY